MTIFTRNTNQQSEKNSWIHHFYYSFIYDIYGWYNENNW